MADIKFIGLTGATGMIGSRLLVHLAEHYPEIRIRCLARSIPSERIHDAVEWLQGDLLSEADCAEFVDGLDAIYHFAQSNSPAISDRHWPSDLVGNIGSSLNLIEALRRRKGQPCHFLFASSGGAIYGQGCPGQEYFSEEDPCIPLSPYGIQKLALEHYLHLASQQGWIKATILRFSNVYGAILPAESRQGLIGVAIARILAGQKIPVFGSEETVRDYLHLDDVMSATTLTMSQNESFKIYNIGAGAGHSLRDVLNILEETSGRAVETEISNFGKTSFALTPRVVLSIQKARNELKWEPKTTLRDGISNLWKSAQRGDFVVQKKDHCSSSLKQR